MSVRKVRRCGVALRVEGFTHVQVGGVVAALWVRALVAGPAEVHHTRGRVGDPIDLLPRTPSDIAGPDLVRPGPSCDAEWIAKSMSHDPLGIGIGAREKRVARQSGARQRVYAQDRAIERRWVGRSPNVLRSKGASLGNRQRHASSGRIAARVDRSAVLAPVGEVEARSIAAADIERPVSAKRQVANRVARVLLTPVGDQRKRLGGNVARRCEPSQAAGHDATVCRRAWRRGTGVSVGVRSSPPRSRSPRHGIVGVERIDVRRCWEVGVQRQTEQAAVPEVVDLRPKVCELCGRCVAERVEDLDHAPLLRYEDASVAGELHGGRVVETGQHNRVLESCR